MKSPPLEDDEEIGSIEEIDINEDYLNVFEPNNDESDNFEENDQYSSKGLFFEIQRGKYFKNADM